MSSLLDQPFSTICYEMERTKGVLSTIHGLRFSPFYGVYSLEFEVASYKVRVSAQCLPRTTYCFSPFTITCPLRKTRQAVSSSKDRLIGSFSTTLADKVDPVHLFRVSFALFAREAPDLQME